LTFPGQATGDILPSLTKIQKIGSPESPCTNKSAANPVIEPKENGDPDQHHRVTGESPGSPPPNFVETSKIAFRGFQRTANEDENPDFIEVSSLEAFPDNSLPRDFQEPSIGFQNLTDRKAMEPCWNPTKWGDFQDENADEHGAK